MQNGQEKMALILGSVGMGKSTLARSLTADQDRLICIDPRAEHHGDVVADSFDSFLQAFQNGFDRGTIVCRHMEDAAVYHDQLFDFLRSCAGWHVFIDEADEYCSPNSFPKPFRDLVNYRRHDHVNLTIVARRAAMIHRDLSALASSVYLFHAHEPNDLDYIKKACGSAYADACRNLPQFQYLEISFPPDRNSA